MENYLLSACFHSGGGRFAVVRFTGTTLYRNVRIYYPRHPIRLDRAPSRDLVEPCCGGESMVNLGLLHMQFGDRLEQYNGRYAYCKRPRPRPACD